jgi:NAD(P)H-flavin reductase
MRHRTAPAATGPLGDWTYWETVDEESAIIRVHGRVDRLGVDLLRGTIEELERRGHTDITVTIGDRSTVDLTSWAVLAQLAEQLADRSGRLDVTWADGDEDRPGEPAGRRGGDRTVATPEGWTAR